VDLKLCLAENSCQALEYAGRPPESSASAPLTEPFFQRRRRALSPAATAAVHQQRFAIEPSLRREMASRREALSSGFDRSESSFSWIGGSGVRVSLVKGARRRAGAACRRNESCRGALTSPIIFRLSSSSPQTTVKPGDTHEFERAAIKATCRGRKRRRGALGPRRVSTVSRLKTVRRPSAASARRTGAMTAKVVVGRRERNAQPTSSKAPGTSSGARSILSHGSRLGAARSLRDPAIAMLHHRDAPSGEDEHQPVEI